jgi:hypothetical protein
MSSEAGFDCRRDRVPRGYGRRAIVLGCALILLGGCGKSQTAATSNSSPPPPATQPATQPLTAAPATAPEPAFVAIDQRRYEFPPAKIVWDAKDGRGMATLYSDDPRSALENKYAGNSFYLQMDMELGDTKPADDKPMDGARWTYRAPSSERSESPTGIYLEGQHWQLQPVDVQAQLEQTGDGVTAYLAGTFLMFDSTNENDHGKIVQVAARLSPQLVKK